MYGELIDPVMVQLQKKRRSRAGRGPRVACCRCGPLS